MTITKTGTRVKSRSGEEQSTWDQLKDDSYAARVTGGGAGGLGGALVGRAGWRYASEHPQVYDAVTKNRAARAVNQGQPLNLKGTMTPGRTRALGIAVPMITGGIGSTIGQTTAEGAVRGAHLSDKFTTGIGRRITPEKYQDPEEDSTDFRESMVGATAAGAGGGAAGYGIAKGLQATSAVPQVRHRARPTVRGFGKATGMATGVSALTSLIARGILNANEKAKDFYELRREPE